jgi:hypothetical protein
MDEYREGMEDGFDEWRSDIEPFVSVPQSLTAEALDWILPLDAGDWITRIPYINGRWGKVYIRRNDLIAADEDGIRYLLRPVRI